MCILLAFVEETLRNSFESDNSLYFKRIVWPIQLIFSKIIGFSFFFSTRGLILTLFIFTQKHVLFAYFVCLLKQLEKNSGKNCSFWFFEEKKLFKIIVCLHNTRKSVKKLPNDCRKLCLLLCFCCSYVFFVRSFWVLWNLFNFYVTITSVYWHLFLFIL